MPLEVETVTADDRWRDGPDWGGLAMRAAEAACAGDGRDGLLTSRTVVSAALRLANDAELRELNRAYRGKDRPTNILSFPMLPPEEARALGPEATGQGGEILLGDMAIAYETLMREAAEQSLAPEDHFVHLVVHGILHLFGHDHVDDAEAERMEALETHVLAGLGVADPYHDRAGA